MRRDNMYEKLRADDPRARVKENRSGSLLLCLHSVPGVPDV